MKTEERYQEIFDKLHQGQQSLDAEEIFISESQEYKAYVAQLTGVLDRVRQEHLLEKKEFLKGLESEPAKTHQVLKLFFWIMPIVLLVSLLFYLFQNTTQVIDQYYETYPMVALKRSNNPIDERTQDGYRYYSEGAYAKALDVLDIYTDETSQFYKAIAFMELNDFENASSILTQLNNEKFPVNYYLGYCYLKLERNQDAKAVLEAVSPKYEYYKNLSTELLNQLEL